MTVFTRLHRFFWIWRAARILCASPFRWSDSQAAQYAAALYPLYLEEGFSPAEAIECDRQYWEP